ncbi:MAG: hypothetical protein J6M53_00470 [Bacteroidaceae bacterium]|nr:hypothetical protein [Bacteroidaceae bacterium]
MTQQDYTPGGIARRKAELKRRIEAKRERLSKMAESLLRPDEATTRAEQFSRTFSRAIAIADGAMTGYKLVRRFGWLVPRRKSRRK